MWIPKKGDFTQDPTITRIKARLDYVVSHGFLLSQVGVNAPLMDQLVHCCTDLGGYNSTVGILIVGRPT